VYVRRFLRRSLGCYDGAATMAKQRNRRVSPLPTPAIPRQSAAVRLLEHPATRIIVVLLLGLLAYSNTLHVPFVFDDEPNIINNPAVRQSAHLPFSGLRWFGLLTFAWNYAWGGLDVFGYHLVNLFIHLTSTVVVYGLVTTTLRTPALATADDTRRAPLVSAWLCSLLFVCHPIQTQAVTYTVQRLASLATLFYLLALLGYARARLPGTPARRTIFYLAAMAGAVLAMKTKEIAFTLPAAILLYELFFFRGKWLRVLAVVPFATIALLVPIALMEHAAAVGPASIENAVHVGADAAIPRYAYLLTQTRVVVTYLRLLCLPVTQNLDYDFPISRSLTAPYVVLSLLFLVSLVGAGLLAYLRSRRSTDAASARLRMMAFGIFWFFLALSVESSVIPLADVIFEHRLYLPSFGAFLAAACAFAMIEVKLTPARARLAKVGAAAVVLALGIAAYARNSVWRDEGVLWMDVLAKSPNKARAHNNAGNLFFLPRGRIEEAISHYQTALRLRPGYADAHSNLGIAYERQGRLDDAAREYEMAIRFASDQWAAHNNLAGIYLKRGRAEDAVREILAYLQLAPGSEAGFFNLGLAYEALGRKDDAIAAFLRVVAINPRHAKTHASLANLYLKQGRPTEAIPHLQRLVSLQPENRAAREALAGLLRGAP
jgi:tetratricopeptide (TPR) repeat protein